MEQSHFIKITSLKGAEFDGVAQDLIFLSLDIKPNATAIASGLWSTAGKQEFVTVDGEKVLLEDYLCLANDDSIRFHKIFKKTYLG